MHFVHQRLDPAAELLDQRSDALIFACGAWLPSLLLEVLRATSSRRRAAAGLTSEIARRLRKPPRSVEYAALGAPVRRTPAHRPLP